MPRRWTHAALVLIAVLVTAHLIHRGWALWGNDPPPLNITPPPLVDGAMQSMQSIPGGVFTMGRAGHGPGAQRVELAPFQMDATEVTNRQFAEFVQTTGYVTVAEQRQWSLVFDRPTGRWRKMAGADWRHPGGPDSTIVGRDALPVVHVSWHDASAFAAWAEKSLPTEAQFEFAARGGVHDRDYPWGQDVAQSTKFANTWQGAFPDADQELDGASGLAAVGEYSPNPFGLYDIVGNVREWCAAPTAARSEPGLRGGSWVSTAEGGTLFVWARQTAPAKFTDNRTGFRCVKKGEFGMTNDEGLMTKE